MLPFVNLFDRTVFERVSPLFVEKLTELAKPETLLIKGELGVAETVLANLAEKAGLDYDRIEIDDLAADITDLTIDLMEANGKAQNLLHKLKQYNV